MGTGWAIPLDTARFWSRALRVARPCSALRGRGDQTGQLAQINSSFRRYCTKGEEGGDWGVPEHELVESDCLNN